MCDENRFQEYIDSENGDFLLKIVPKTLKKGDVDEISDLKEALQEIISIWRMDIECKKATIKNSDYFYILKTVEKIDKEVKFIDRGVYFSYKAEYAFKFESYKTALYYANKSKSYFCKSIMKNLDSPSGYSLLHDLYKILYTNVKKNSEKYLEKSLKTLNDGIMQTKFDGLYFDKWRFFREYRFKNISKSLKNLFFNERDTFIKELTQKSIKNSNFSFEIASLYTKTLYYSDAILEDSEEKFELELFLKLAMFVKSENIHKITDYGHIYYKAGEKLHSLEFLNRAKDFFIQAITTRENHALHYVYLADTYLKIGDIYNSNSKIYNQINNKVKNIYLKNFSSCSNDISYLIHSSEYFFKYFNILKTKNEQIDWIKKIYPILIQGEKVGKGFYWKPYLSLILANCFLNNFLEAKIWLKRAFLKLNILIDKDLEKLQDFFYTNGYNELESFNKKLIEKLKNIKPKYFDGGEKYENLILVTSKNIEDEL